MAEILLFHHAAGQTESFNAFADELRAAGHTVHTPDLFDGRTFTDLHEGVAYAQEVGFPNLIERGVAAAESLPEGLVYAGFSLGCMPAEKLAISRPGAKGALLMSGFADTSWFGGEWPRGVPVQIHVMEDDAWSEEDIPAARKIAAEVDGAELFLYPGSRHLFVEHGPEFDPEAGGLVRRRAFEFLARLD